MCALVPHALPISGWPIEDSIIHQYNCTAGTTSVNINEPVQHFPGSHQPLANLDRSASYYKNINEDTATMVKKINHNASERERRKKMNGLYLSLRSLLPVTDQTKKLSIPATVSQVLKYIPQLQQQVERLARKKERLLSRLSSQGDVNHQENQKKSYLGSNLSPISVNRLNENEIVVQISTNNKADKGPLSEILLCLEEDGLVLINTSTHEYFGGRVFYNLHLQVEGSYKLDSDILTEKLLTVYEKRDEWFM